MFGRLGVKPRQWIETRKRYISVRISDQRLQLIDGDDIRVGDRYVFVTRSNNRLRELAFELAPRAVYSTGRLDALYAELIRDGLTGLLGATQFCSTVLREYKQRLSVTTSMTVRK